MHSGLKSVSTQYVLGESAQCEEAKVHSTNLSINLRIALTINGLRANVHIAICAKVHSALGRKCTVQQERKCTVLQGAKVHSRSL